MKFKDLENAVIGETILVNSKGYEYIFMGFTPNKNKIFVVSNDAHQTILGRYQYEIENWKIKQPERETIQLYETRDSDGYHCDCDENGNIPEFNVCRLYMGGRFNDIRKRNIIKPSIKIYKDTFEIVRE